ncbi:ACR224Cp [Eremothecium gossypii ATCC 10895]|uniref:DNA-directed RNA polymerase n=1 Tax=Eremothecium gossypii (strain ATCC 10895 / CBS 109.51 / FGSC 9923 / NRRL Y-1056) TaxID=284811 RepID=Q75BP7_EREGS|nr:ACR224Cp [Eremothecium gossypii ATCC 10895]AAS51450.1 ACR224Cp [Eremothecium gossypii ATCC 10895]AEY95741.1 FACR224Cp [Eremothecium gossypii FDAG1]
MLRNYRAFKGGNLLRHGARHWASRPPVGAAMVTGVGVTHLALSGARSTSTASPANDMNVSFERSSSVSISPDFALFDTTDAPILASQRSNVMNQWALLEACLCTGYLDRAFKILKSLYSIDSHRPYFMNDYNSYLLRYCEENQPKSDASVQELRQKVFDDISKHFPEVQLNAKSAAILVRYALSANPYSAQKEDVRTLMEFATSRKQLLEHNDVLRVQDYASLCKMGLCDLKHVPIVTRSLVQDSLGVSSTDKSVEVVEEEPELVSAESEDLLSEDIKSLDKNAAELRSVGTFGMRAVRHSLLGLELGEKQRERLSGLAVDPLLKASMPAENGIDFFEIYKSLETDKERQAFDSFLEDFNSERQCDLESRSVTAAKQRWKHEFAEAQARGALSVQRSLNAQLWEWYLGMIPLLKEEVKACRELLASDILLTERRPHIRSRLEYAPYITLVNPEKMCVITILELLSLNSTGGVSEGMRTTRAVLAIGKAVEMEYRSEALLKSEKSIFKEVRANSNEFKKLVQRAKTTFRNTQIEESKVLWPHNIKAKVGSLLISMLIHVAKVNVKGVDPVTNKTVYGKAPAICHTFQYRMGSKVGVLKLHRSLANQMSSDRLSANFQPQHLPMLVKPRPWTSWNSGGYLFTKSTLIRSKDSPEQSAYIKAVTGKGVVQNVYKGLNVLGETAWTVNKNMLHIISKVWNSGTEFLDIPPQQDELLLPAKPRGEDGSEPEPIVLKRWKQECRFLNAEYQKHRSMRCDANYKLEIARAFIGEKFYFPHNMDFRGRAYPLAPHFNHLGNDMTRSLLIFWEGKRLGKEGLRWLKIHMGNLYGLDKQTFEARVAFTEAHLEDIKDSAENPLNGKGWWKKADKPWQCLATCMEINNAYKLSNPEDYVSHQPVHQDGTCNGLQHYAALGGDIEGARQVNLVPSDKPQDVYAFVAKLVTERLEKAALEGDQNAAQLKNLITRKVVKRTVMTNVYGVTFIGATNQIDKELQDAFPDNSYDMARYLTKHVFNSIRELFHAAHLIQDWLGESAKKISKSIRLDLELEKIKKLDNSIMMTSVIWTSPLGLPVVQPYRDIKKKQIHTNLQTVFIADPFAVNPIDPRRQMAGFPPNFIHSLDASHMLLSAIECGRLGLQFAAVHDSYWTHASDVPKMNKALRNEFVKMHQVDLIQRLKNEFDARYKNYLEVKRIKKRSELGQELLLLRSRLSKSLGRPITMKDELEMERKRQNLLNSEDPVLRAEGERMVTTVSFMSDKDTTDMETSTHQSVCALVPLKFSGIPPKGSYDIRQLVNSKYFFS